jgi:hypothetical protein
VSESGRLHSSFASNFTCVLANAEFQTPTPSRLLLYLIRSSSEGLNSSTFVVVAIIHAVITLIPTLRVTLCPPPDHRWDSMLIPFLVNVVGVVVMPMCLVLQFTAQLRMPRNRNSDLNSISLLSWCLQVPVLAAAAFRWVCRAGLPPWFPPEQYRPHFRLWLWDIMREHYVHCMMSINCLVWASEMYLLVAYSL